MLDAGADAVLDFIDAGYASTYRVPLVELQTIATTLISRLHQAGVDAIVLEIADGLYQAETAALLSSPQLQTALDGLIFASNDAMGACGGIAWLRQHELPVYAISGVLTRSPLAVREAQAATGLPILTLETLHHPAIVKAFQPRRAEPRQKHRSHPVHPAHPADHADQSHPHDQPQPFNQFSPVSTVQVPIQAA